METIVVEQVPEVTETTTPLTVVTPVSECLPFGGAGKYNLLDYARMVGTPIGKAGALVGGMICNDEVCHRGTILTLAAVVAYYGWTRRDLVGYGLMASAAGAALFTLFDAPRVSPAPMDR